MTESSLEEPSVSIRERSLAFAWRGGNRRAAFAMHHNDKVAAQYCVRLCHRWLWIDGSGNVVCGHRTRCNCFGARGFDPVSY
jgi:hypothetical protein